MENCNHQNNQQNNHRLTNGQPSANHQATTNKNDKNDKNVNKYKKSKIDFSIFSNEIINFAKKIFLMFPKSIIENLSEKEKYNWLKEIEKLNRLDDLSFEKIENIVKYGRQNDFWQAQFLSLLKLRKKNKDGIKFWLIFQEQIEKTKKLQSKKQVLHDSDY